MYIYIKQICAHFYNLSSFWDHGKDFLACECVCVCVCACVCLCEGICFQREKFYVLNSVFTSEHFHRSNE